MTPSRGEKFRSPWKEDEAETAAVSAPEPRHFGRWIIAALTVLALIAGGIWWYWATRPQGANVGFSFSPPANILEGEPFTLPLSISNSSSLVLSGAHLTLTLPDGVVFAGGTPDQRVREQQLGDMGPGSVVQEAYELIATGGAQSLKHIAAKLVYATSPDARTQFEAHGAADVLVGGPALQLSLDAPANVLNGQDFTASLHYHNFSSRSFQNVRLKVTYPPIYEFKSSNINPDQGTENTWTFGSLKSGADGTIQISGNVIGPENSFFTIESGLSADYEGQTYVLADQTASLGISAAPLSVTVAANDDSNFIAHIGDTLNYTIAFKNNSQVAFQNLQISAKLTSVLFDYSTLKADATFDSVHNTISWIAANDPDLQTLPPGGQGAVTFQVKLKSSFPISLVSDKNFSLKVNAQAQSPTVPPGTAASQTISVANLETKVAGALVLQTKGLWRDAASGFLNTGPYPPRVNQATQYTIHWILTNYSTDAQNVHVEAFLQSGAHFTGDVKSNMATSPAYDAGTGRVSWDIPLLIATKGVASPPAEAAFQIEATPGVNQVGQSLPLMGESQATAQDAFTGGALAATAGVVTSDLPDDSSITAQDRRVQQ